MKKIIVMAIAVFAVVAAHAQGTVVFANSTGSLVTLPGGASAPNTGSLIATLWFSPTQGGTLVSLGTTPVGQISGTPVAGRFSGGTLTTPDVANGGIAPAGNAYFQVTISGSLGGQAYTGQSALLFRPTGGGLVAAQNLYSVPNPNPNNYTGLGPIALVPVPEPSVIALAAAGIGFIMLRRRKQ
jgi:hypothetical protein